MATLNLKTKFFPLAFILYLFPPLLTIDGGESQKVRWGDNTLQLAAGSHHLEIYYPYFWFLRAGKAKTDLTAQEGQTINAVYHAPTWFVFARGKIKLAQA